jgi:hypothetical protein
MSAETQSMREEPAVRAWAVAAIAASLIVFLAASLGLLWLFYRAQTPGLGATQPAPFPAPGVTTDTATTLRALQEGQRERLQGYAWVDRDRRLVHVPIERAMAAIAAKGARAYDPVTPPAEPGAAPAHPAAEGGP